MGYYVVFCSVGNKINHQSHQLVPVRYVPLATGVGEVPTKLSLHIAITPVVSYRRIKYCNIVVVNLCRSLVRTTSELSLASTINRQPIRLKVIDNYELF